MRAAVGSILMLISLSKETASPVTARTHSCATQQLSACMTDPVFHILRSKGNAALYNLDYKTARDCFDRMTGLAPGHPAGYVYSAAAIWVEMLNDRRRLSSSLYSNQSFYVQGPGQDQVERTRDLQFNELIRKAKEAADARLKKNPEDAEVLYYMGAALGLRAAYNFSIKRSWRTAISDAKESVRIQNRVLKLDPHYTDARLSVGLYEYTVGSLPFLYRLFARLLGVSGSKKDGINHLQVVAEGGKYAQDDAQVLLVIIYSRENQPERALELISRLSSRYPRNYLLGVERAVMLYRLGRHDEGARVFNELLNNSDITADATDVVSYQYGEALMETGKYGDAGLRYKAVMDWPKSEPDLVTLAHLRRGQALDALGRHDEARKEYQTVLKRDDAYNCHNLARKYNKKPYIPSAN